MNNESSQSFKLLSFIKDNVVQAVIALLVLVLTIVQVHQTFRQKKISETQVSLDMIMFVREYINGYVYLYDEVLPRDVDRSIKEIRRAGLPALAVPSQYSADHYLIITHSFGNFSDFKTAEREILQWRNNLVNWDRSKAILFEKFQKQWKLKDVEVLVFYYKADIVIHRRYFEKLASSSDFLVLP